MVPITVQVPNSAMTYQSRDGVHRAALNLFARVSTLTGRVVSTFETEIRSDVPDSLLQQSLKGSSITQKSLRQQIGLVSQETFLFHDTIFQNILFGRLDATKEEIYDAAKTAYAHEFIMAQPKGYETIIGDKGCLLSGGQQQRLAIARALLKNAPILLLDEATSALDSESEQQIQLALERLAQGRTVIAIAHRLSTILSADQIVVMEKGRIKEIGTHAELLENSGYYRRLYDLQFNRNPEEPGAEVELLAEATV